MAVVESSSPCPMASRANVTQKEMDLEKDHAAHQKGFVEILWSIVIAANALTTAGNSLPQECSFVCLFEYPLLMVMI